MKARLAVLLTVFLSVIPSVRADRAPAQMMPDAPTVALARVDPDRSRIADFGADLHVTVGLDRPVPWRVFTLDEPRRLVVDFAEADFPTDGLADLVVSDGVLNVGTGRVRPGWSRLVAELAQPYRIETAGLQTDGGLATLKLQLAPTNARAFAEGAGEPESALFSLPRAAAKAPLLQDYDGALHVMLDPGHGGMDPGAEAGGIRESDLVLDFARDLAVALREAGLWVSLTRDDDRFVPLEARMSAVRAAGADVFLSLHADAVSEGDASGASAYTFAREASDAAARTLAAWHDRSDILSGADLSRSDDEVAAVLLDLARTETAPRSEALADALIEQLGEARVRLHKRPRHAANFSVLKAADFPSVLLEIGFLSSPADRDSMTDPAWRAAAIHAICEGLVAWARADAERGQPLTR